MLTQLATLKTRLAIEPADPQYDPRLPALKSRPSPSPSLPAAVVHRPTPLQPRLANTRQFPSSVIPFPCCRSASRKRFLPPIDRHPSPRWRMGTRSKQPPELPQNAAATSTVSKPPSPPSPAGSGPKRSDPASGYSPDPHKRPALPHTPAPRCHCPPQRLPRQSQPSEAPSQ